MGQYLQACALQCSQRVDEEVKVQDAGFPDCDSAAMLFET